MTGDEGVPAPRPEELPEDEGPIGIFPSWGWLYATVLVWFVVVVVVLYVLTVTLDYGAG
jgi:hypothetical protein